MSRPSKTGSEQSCPEKRLNELGIVLPPVAKPIAAYQPAVRSGNLVFTSGQLPSLGGVVTTTGKLGERVTVNTGREAARTACLNALAAVRAVLGDLDRVERVVSLSVFVQSSDYFFEQAQVANGASELLEEVFGDAGRHVRMAVGANALPLNAAVELALVVAAKPDDERSVAG